MKRHFNENDSHNCKKMEPKGRPTDLSDNQAQLLTLPWAPQAALDAPQQSPDRLVTGMKDICQAPLDTSDARNPTGERPPGTPGRRVPLPALDPGIHLDNRWGQRTPKVPPASPRRALRRSPGHPEP